MAENLAPQPSRLGCNGHSGFSDCLLDELDYLPIDKRGADQLLQVVAARYESGSIVLTTNRVFRE